MKSLIATLFFLFIFGSVGAAQNDSDPVLQSSASYAMPQSALDAEIDGAVVVGIRVDETGKVSKVALISGPMWPCGTTPVNALEDLSSTLTDTLRKLSFSPAIKDGKAITREVGLTITLKNPKLATKPAEIYPATGKPIAKEISGGVLNGKAKHLPKPRYPSEARANGDAGAVIIQVLIDEEGKVIRAGGVSGAAGLQLAAREAACAAKFAPTRLSGNPVKVSGVLAYAFVP